MMAAEKFNCEPKKLTDEAIEYFFELLNKKLEEGRDMLIERFNLMAEQPPKAARFLYENNMILGYDGETVFSAIKHGTLVLGKIGSSETLQILIGKNHTTKEGMELAKRIEGTFKTRCAEFKALKRSNPNHPEWGEYFLNFGNYNTPSEGLCYTSMNKFKKEYGIIPNVSDREFFTNSIHIPVWEEISPFEKIDLESQLTGYSNSGCITYVELDSKIKNNLPALENLVTYAMEKDVPYFAINVPNDTCLECGYTEDLEEDTCPICEGTIIERLARVTGYLSSDYRHFNKGKQAEVKDRFKHSKLMEM
mgnify:CR=1 FL=1